MTYQWDFAVKHLYNSREIGITIKTVLRKGDIFAVCDAKIDTGSEFCLFGREFGEQLDIEIESGHRINLSTLTSGFVAYGHEVTIETFGLTFDTFIYFAEDYAIRRNLLGRQGWLQLVKFGLDDYKSEIYISLQEDDI